ncbi:MAG TPA: amino acid adenylation domain-containing protein, partial [Thermoanaerobaculia bacterium]|nr:amino acid adenylation domain-containing protein [Thermoanaerobaculia bacterium]
MKPEEVEDVYPLSPMQEGILFHSLYDREEEPYFRQWSGRLSGGLDVAGLLAAWHQVMDHHPVLRTAFVWQGLDKPLQVVCRAVRLPLVWQDWSQLAESDQRARLGDYLRRDRRRGFELSEAPLMRLALFDLGEGSWRMVWSFHHLLLDGWSLAIVLRQVMGAYLERQAGRSPSLPPAPPFRQYIAWLKGQELVAAESFWRQLLRGFERPTQLPIDRGSPLDNVTVSRHSRQRLISAATSDALTALCRSQRLTLNALFQGLWSLLLARYSGERSVVFGATVSGRPPELAQVESMVGLFINTLPVRSEVHAGDRLLPWLRDLQTVQARARQFSFAPLASIQRWAEVPAGQALFSTLLVFENYRLEEAAGPRAGSAQVTLEDTAFADGSSYPLSLILRPDAPISLRVLYSRERFEATAIDRLLGHLIALAEGALRAPASRLGELDLLSPAERQQLCREWSDTRVAYGEAGEGATLHGLIGRLAERDPEAVAVVCGDEALSYRQLIAGARGLAGRLVALGARPDGLVGIAAERSLELMVGLLAILEAGAAYVPIDPSYPAERLAFMLADSEVPLLLTLEAHRQSLPEPWRTGPGTLVLDREELLRHGAACGPCTGRGGGGDRLAYMIYTSGSTGRPKGAMNSHRAILNRLLWMQAEYRLGPGDRVLQKTPVSFDVSVWELFWPLMTGATLVLAEPGRHGDGSYLAAEIARRRITTLHFVPPMLRVFLAEPDLSGCDSVRRVMASGEALPGELAQRCYARLPQGARLHNLYGPTEAAVDVTYWACPPSAEVLPVPIGRPIANTAIHVLDERFAPTPIGVPGEVAIGGVNLARGYWRRPGLSAEKFVPDPVGEVEGERLYRTGDLARRWAGGEVEYLGRIDFQVKIRGFRIELGEIEAALLGCAGVLAAAVVVRPGPSGDGQLVAYFVTEAGSKVSPAELRRALGSRLPEHMVPAFWLHLDALPLTPSGKLDRKALPAPGGALAEAGLADPPEGPLEELVAGVWCEVLGLSRVGRGASFFELGGHSLLATRVVARLRETLGLEVPLRELFEHPRLVELAAALEERLRGAEGRARPALEARSRAEAPGGGAERLPLSWAQERLWFLEQWEPGGSVYNVPLALRLSGELSVPALAASLGVVEARHESLRTRFAGSGESAWQEVAAPRRPWPLPVVDVSGLATPVAEGEARRLMQQDMERGFDLARGPLWRGLLVRLGEAEHGLLLLLHHIASDGWSLGVLTRELVALYQAGGEEAAAGLPELPVQYGDYALWQRSWLSGELLAAELAWWRERLSGWGGLLELPWDRPRPAQRSSAGSALGFAVPAAVVGQLRAWGRRHGATLFMTSLGALQALLARLAGTERLVVGTPVAGRTERSTEELIGFFVNTLVVRGDLAGSPTGAELWGRVREELLAAWSHQEVPFEKLVAELEPERSPSFTPVFQVMFALQNAPRQRGGVAGLALSSWEWQRWSAKFDLTWSAVEEEGGGVRVAVEWSTALFDRTTIERWGRSYGTLLAAMAAAPERPVAALPWLSAAERWQLLGEWNDSAAAFPREATISSLFAEQVALRGEALALAWDDEQWSYGALEVWSAALARRLQARGAGLETPTVVALERSPEMVVAFLAILRLGSFYVPIDPSYPVFRQRLIVEEMGAALVVAGPEQGARLMEDPAAALAVPAWPGWTGPVAPARGPQPSSLAYVIFTSGSTGRPKGVAVPHRAVLRLVRGADYVNLQPGCRVAQASNSAFDAATFELWGALLNGGVLIGVERETALSLERFGALLVARRVDHLFVTTALFNQLAREVPASLASLSTLLFGGEAVDPRPVRGLLGQGGPQNLLHVYGPTENTTFSSWEPVRQLAASAWTVPIGGPISSTRLWVVSSSGEAVGAGVPGELWLGGEGLARGYWARPALTAERFVPLPFGEGSGERAYRTGDRVRWLAGGTVEFLGRFDHQVKLRGFRIE